MSAPPPSGVLFIGSAPFASAKQTFKTLGPPLQGRLAALVDGEPGERQQYILWQRECFPPEVRNPHAHGPKELPADVADRTYTLDSIGPTRYDVAAAESYAEFKALRAAGSVPAGVKFQMGVPTPYNVLRYCVRPELLARIEPLYEARFAEGVAGIAAAVPHDDLVVQWDMCLDVIALEAEAGRVANPGFAAYFQPVREGLVERLGRMCAALPGDVPIAFHLCYGDYKHKHWVEPEDLSRVVAFANAIYGAVGKEHKVAWFHLPVPKDRKDEDYFKALNDLKVGDAYLYLGLVHENDLEGTKERIAAAQKVFTKQFGVGTECGLGRVDYEDIDDVIQTCKTVTIPLAG